MTGQRTKLLSIIALLFFAAPLTAAQDAPNLSEAKKEQRVVLYASGNLSMVQAVTGAFQKKYPFLSVPITRSSGERLLNKVRTEQLAGKILFDVVFGATVPYLPAFNVLQRYSSPEAKAYPSKFKDPNGLWSGVSANYYVIGYNTSLVSKKDAPKDWDDLLDPKWKGKIGMDPEEFTWLGAMENYLGKEKAGKFFTALARQDLQWRKGHTHVAQLMLAGEFELALVYAHRIEQMKAQGGPVEWVRSAKPIVADLQAVALSAKPKAPNGARLLYDFFLSQEAQKAIYDDGKVPIRPGAVPESSALHASGLELYPTPAEVITKLNEYTAKFDRIFNPGR
jgi:iron(III) transport system substrate-binding protein